MSNVETTRIDNFVCPACGEVMRQVVAYDGVVKGWCQQTRKEIKVNVCDIKHEDIVKEPAAGKDTPAELDYLGSLKFKRAKVLKEVVSAREDGDLKENSGYHAAREQLSILDDKILKEEDRIRRGNQNNQ
jgi:hypothetical protein